MQIMFQGQQRTAIVFVVIAAIGLLVPTGLAQAYSIGLEVNGSLHIEIITDPGREVYVGQPVEVFVHVFDKAVPIDPDELNVTIERYDPGTYEYDPLPVSMVKTSTGVYQGTYTPTAQDAASGSVAISAVAADDKNRESESAYLMCTEDAGAEAAIELTADLGDALNNLAAAPGEALTWHFTVTKDTAPFDPENITVNYYSYFGMSPSGGFPSMQNLAPQRLGVGSYKFMFTIPDALTVSTTYSFFIVASGDEYQEYEMVLTTVNFYSAWYHNITKTATGTTFELYFLDENGGKLAAAAFEGSYRYYSEDSDWIVVPFSARPLDADGKVTLTMTVPPEVEYVEYGVWANKTKQQFFSQSFSLPVSGGGGSYTPEQPQGYGLEVIPQISEPDVEPGKQFTCIYKAYFTEGFSRAGTPVPLANAPIYCYVRGNRDMLFYHAYTTAADGTFTVDFPAPAQADPNEYSYDFVFEAPVRDATVYEQPATNDGKVYEEANGASVTVVTEGGGGDGEEEYTIDEQIAITTGTIETGSAADITVQAPGLNTGMLCMLTWVPGVYEPNSTNDEPDWQPIGASVFGMFELLEYANGKFVGTIFVPWFVGSDQTITIGVFISDSFENGPMGDDVRMNLIHVQVGTSGQTGQSDKKETKSWLPGFTEPAVILSLLVVGLVLFYKRRR